MNLREGTRRLALRLGAFQPYRLVVGVVFSAICEDFGLSLIEDAGFENYRFTAISASLFARSDDREYSSDIYLSVDVPCAVIDWNPGFGSILGNRPRFFFHRARAGYQFGIEVALEWWSQHRQQLSETVRNLPVNPDGTIVLGFLPDDYFPVHVWLSQNVFFSSWESWQKVHQRWQAKLAKYGWFASEDRPEYITHRYMGISQYKI